MRSLLLATALLAAAAGAALTPTPAVGYAEDACPAPGGGGWGPCSVRLPVEEACRAGADLPVCSAALMLAPAATGPSRLVIQQLSTGARSVHHTDVLYALAQVAGLTPREAFLTAAYSAATDVAQYFHRDGAAQLMPDPAQCTGERRPPACALLTSSVTGVDRNNFSGGGIFLHFQAPFSDRPYAQPGGRPSLFTSLEAGAPPPVVDSLVPNLTDGRRDPVVVNARRWAFGLGPLCVAGLTTATADGDPASGDACFRRPDGAPATIAARLPFLSQTGSITDLQWVAELGELELTAPGAPQPVPARRIGEIVGPDAAPFARLGIYLHALGDRVSHHLCDNDSYVVGPRPTDAEPVLLNPVANAAYQAFAGNETQVVGQPVIVDPDFVVIFSTTNCDQTNHGRRHELEFGRPQAGLDPADRTAAAGIPITLDELQAFTTSPAGKLAGVRRSGPRVDPAALGRDLLAAIEVPDAGARLRGIAEATRKHCLVPMPGMLDETYDRWARRAAHGAEDEAPWSRITGLTRRGRHLTIHGTAADRGCAGVDRVELSVSLRRRDGRCRFLRRDGSLTRARSCRAPVRLRADGAFRLRVRSPRARGRYVVRARAIDRLGNDEPLRPSSTRSRDFAVR